MKDFCITRKGDKWVLVERWTGLVIAWFATARQAQNCYKWIYNK